MNPNKALFVPKPTQNLKKRKVGTRPRHTLPTFTAVIGLSQAQHEVLFSDMANLNKRCTAIFTGWLVLNWFCGIFPLNLGGFNAVRETSLQLTQTQKKTFDKSFITFQAIMSKPLACSSPPVRTICSFLYLCNLCNTSVMVLELVGCHLEL